MLTKLNPRAIIIAHWNSFRDDATGKLSWAELIFHAVAPAAAAATYTVFGEGISENAAGIVVSAASIAAGLLLNLLVLIYTLVYNAKSARQQIKNLDAMRQVCDEALATIAYCILLSLLLVVAAFFAIAPRASVLSAIGQPATIYLGTANFLCVLIILKRVFALVHFEIQR